MYLKDSGIRRAIDMAAFLAHQSYLAPPFRKRSFGIIIGNEENQHLRHPTVQRLLPPPSPFIFLLDPPPSLPHSRLEMPPPRIKWLHPNQ